MPQEQAYFPTDETLLHLRGFHGRLPQAEDQGENMRKYLLAATAAAAVMASPAMARDGSVYVGIEGGVLFPKDNDADVFADFTTTQVPGSPVAAAPADTTYEDMFGIDYKRGYDVDAILGYDFGMFRLEGEIGYKKTKVNEFEIDNSDIAALNLALNRPSGAGDPGAPGQPALSSTDFDLNGNIKVWSAMVNGLVDFGDEDGLSFYAGAGAGRARAKAFGDTDSAWAFQGIAGLRYAVSRNIDLGLKYRYFQTGKLNFAEDPIAVNGNGDAVVVGTTPVITTTNAVLFPDFEQKFRSHSLLASLNFNFGGGSEALPPPPPPPPPMAPPPPPPATQTCPDGSVILATDICPPPPPPPPPAPMPERG
jgi:opacity protein-like surface antigen